MTSALPEPVSKLNRVPLIDALRGFALFGILFVNMTWFTGFAVLSPQQREALGTAGIDGVVYWLIHCLVDSKFWSLFALLFGVGVAMQRARAESRGEDFRFRLVRRLLVLVIIGLLHAVFLWFGDIVSLYAVVGFGLLLFARASDRTVLICAIGLLLLPIVQNLVWVVVNPSVDTSLGPAQLLAFFADGNYAEVLSANWAYLTKRWFLAVYDGRFMKLLGMFLIGYWAERQEVFRHPRQNMRLLWGVLVGGLLIGLPASAALATLKPPPPSLASWVYTSVNTIAVPVLCLGYVAAFTLMYSSARLARGLRIFAHAGRMSLTHYIAQSAIGIVVFYGCGLGNWGRIGVAWSVVLIAIIFGLQTLVSLWWLARFQNGPLEWIWRCLTYGRRLPLRIDPQRRPASATG